MSIETVSGELERAGAALVVAVALVASVSACAAPARTVATEVETISEDSPQGPEGAAAVLRRERDVAILEWAVERGILEPSFSVQAAIRAERDSLGTRHGARDTALWAQYQDFIEQQSQALKNEIRDRQTVDDVRAYYAQHPEQFDEQDHLTVDVTEWEDGRAISTHSLEITAERVRELQEDDDQLISAALDLAQGQRTTVDRGGGRFAQVSCVTRTDAGTAPFDEVVQAAAAQLASDLFESELDDRIAALRERP